MATCAGSIDLARQRTDPDGSVAEQPQSGLRFRGQQCAPYLKQIVRIEDGPHRAAAMDWLAEATSASSSRRSDLIPS